MAEQGARPAVTVSYAQTLDGRIATVTGSSQWISGPESLRLVHELRADHDAIMVGVGTVCRDDPRLTVRLAPGRDPLRVVVDSTLRTPLSAAVLAAGAAGTILAVTVRAPRERIGAVEALGATVLCLPETSDGRVDPAGLLAALQARGIRTVMVEGGARLFTSLLRVRLVDRLVVTVAPTILGAGIAAVGDLGLRDLADALRLDEVRVRHYGRDVVIDGQLTYGAASDA